MLWRFEDGGFAGWSVSVPMPISGACTAAEKGPMLKALRFRSAFCFATIGMLMLIPATASAQALQGYVKTKGIKQGQFKGEGALLLSADKQEKWRNKRNQQAALRSV